MFLFYCPTSSNIMMCYNCSHPQSGNTVIGHHFNASHSPISAISTVYTFKGTKSSMLSIILTRDISNVTLEVAGQAKKKLTITGHFAVLPWQGTQIKELFYIWFPMRSKCGYIHYTYIYNYIGMYKIQNLTQTIYIKHIKYRDQKMAKKNDYMK